MKHIFAVAVIVVFAVLISQTLAGECMYEWNNACSSNCSLDTPSYWNQILAGPESPKDCPAMLEINNPLTNAYSESDWQILRLWAPNCSKKKSIQEVQGGATPSIIELNFSNNKVDLGYVCLGVSSFKNYLTFTNTTFTASQPGFSNWEVDGSTWKFVDSTVNLNYTNFESYNGGNTYEFINSKVFKHIKTYEENVWGIHFFDSDILKIHNTEFTLATGMNIPSGMQVILSGNTKIDVGTQEEPKNHYWASNVTILANSNVTITQFLALQDFNFKSNFFKIEANAILNTLYGIDVNRLGLFTFDIYGTLNTETFKYLRAYDSSNGDSTIINLHTGGVLNTNGLYGLLSLKKRNIDSLDKRAEFGNAVCALLVQGGVLNSNGPTTIGGYAYLNITSGTASFNGETILESHSVNFLGGDASFHGVTSITYPVTIYGGSVLFSSNVTTNGNGITVENGGGLILEGGLLTSDAVVNDGYISGYGKFNGSVTVNANSEVRLESVSNHLNVAGKATIKATAKIIISADNNGCAQANVGSLDLANGVVFDISLGQVSPANNSECTILKYETTFTGSVPSQPITEPNFGAILTITHDQNAKEIKVQISLPPPPSPNTPSNGPPTEPNTPSNGPTTTPPPNTPNAGSKITVGFGIVLLAVFMMLISLLN